MTAKSFVPALALAVLLQLAAVRLLPPLAGHVDLLLLVTILNGLSGNTLMGMLGGLVCGLLSDTLSGQLYGLYGFADTIVGYCVARVAQLLVAQRPASLVLLSTGAAALQQITLTLLVLALVPEPELPPPESVVILLAVTGILGLLFWSIHQRLMARRERLRPSSTLRL